jgi:cytochrome c oxidase cbb3-type subunit 1
MSQVTLRFIKASLLYLLTGISMGLLMLLWPRWMGVYLPIHAHINLLGWVSMLMFGVSYHILPRFSGKQLYSDMLASLHFWFANIGLIGLSFFWAQQRHRGGGSETLIILFALIEAAACYMFVFNMWMTIFGKAKETA